MLADKVKKPLLLIHGEEDNNSGTLTMQVCFKLPFLATCYLGKEFTFPKEMLTFVNIH